MMRHFREKREQHLRQGVSDGPPGFGAFGTSQSDLVVRGYTMQDCRLCSVFCSGSIQRRSGFSGSWPVGLYVWSVLAAAHGVQRERRTASSEQRRAAPWCRRPSSTAATSFARRCRPDRPAPDPIRRKRSGPRRRRREVKFADEEATSRRARKSRKLRPLPHRKHASDPAVPRAGSVTADRPSEPAPD
ncbi:hypothetical protein HPB51_017372 [Rhipicephalus microplus]|uniref:Uncharacterized protein n=1 Tax=Rhipicephalus microplus TaxID=6941 RepID=A0A9J6DVZ6_RHIMP|nr:hypothetical protein HPB51_017372 [Rhipicephalus microplus]